jgi:MoaA/NifB/PqqE/SkfB family radical SAM enzyme
MKELRIIVIDKLKKIARLCLPNAAVIAIRHFLLKQRAKKRLVKRQVLRFGVQVVDHCNLNCVGCGVFASISDKNCRSVTTIDADLKRIKQLAGEQISEIVLLGGEPLLHPQIIDIMNITGAYFPNTNLIILTNGLLLMQQEPIFWETCRKNKIKIQMTKYPINLPFEKIEARAKEHNANFTYWGKSGAVQKTMHKLPLSLKGDQDIETSFRMCHKSNACIVLEDGKIYTCSTVSRIKYFNKTFNTNLEISENDYIDIYKADDIDQIFEFLHNPIPFCRYCNTKDSVYGIKWEKSKRQMSEWV